MEHYAWTREISTGIRELDEQHKNFITLFNFCMDNCESLRFDIKKAKDHLNQILIYAREHITTEERYFKKYNYPATVQHSKKHAELLIKIIKLHDSFDGSKEAEKKVLDLLDYWVNEHMKKDDMLYSEYFKLIKIDPADKA